MPFLLSLALYASTAARLQHGTRGVAQARARGRPVGHILNTIPVGQLKEKTNLLMITRQFYSPNATPGNATLNVTLVFSGPCCPTPPLLTRWSHTSSTLPSIHPRQ